MKIKEGYIISTVAGENVVLPTGNDLDLRYMITLNDTGKFLWEQLQEEKTEEDLLQAVLAAYEGADQEQVNEYIKEFVMALKEYDLLSDPSSESNYDLNNYGGMIG